MVKVDAFVDVRNEICSRPALKVKTKLSQLRPGDILEVLADKSSKDDITRIFGKVLGHEILDVISRKKNIRILIKKREVCCE
ncbi:MAG: sulfurtransferase TusA family protein [Candidatus Bathyarchaeia archaeon]